MQPTMTHGDVDDASKVSPAPPGMSHLQGGFLCPCDKATCSWFSDPMSGNEQTGEVRKRKKKVLRPATKIGPPWFHNSSANSLFWRLTHPHPWQERNDLIATMIAT